MKTNILKKVTDIQEIQVGDIFRIDNFDVRNKDEERYIVIAQVTDIETFDSSSEISLHDLYIIQAGTSTSQLTDWFMDSTLIPVYNMYKITQETHPEYFI